MTTAAEKLSMLLSGADRTIEATRLVDVALRGIGEQRLLDSDRVRDWLLDVRNALTASG